MKVKTVSYSKVFSLGNYENEKLGVEFDIAELYTLAGIGEELTRIFEKAIQCH